MPLYVAKAKLDGTEALGITDHGNVCNVPAFYRECRNNDIEPVIGEEFYFVPDNARYKEMKGERFHITILARGAHGYKVLSDLSTEAHRHFHYKPCIDRSIIKAMSKKDRASLTVMSGCAGSILSRKILGTEPGSADEEVLWWKKMFPHYFIEIMHHDTSFDVKLNMGLIKLAKRHGIPWVITNDPHYVHKDDACHHDALLAIQTGSDIDDPERFRFEGKGYWLKNEKEIQKSFKRYGQDIWQPGIKQTRKIAKDCFIRIPEWEVTSWHIPKYPFVKDSREELMRLAKKGLKKRRLLDIEFGDLTLADYKRQLKEEMRAFDTVSTPSGAGMADFLLITLDAIEKAKRTIDPATKRPIPVGPGRGSVCSTLIGYLIGIHKMDPLYYDLLFQRFFNPERPKMPDVDTDYGRSGRPLVLDYYPERYGAGNTAPVAAFGTMQVKRAFQSLGSAYGLSFQKRMALSKKIQEDEEGNHIWPREVLDEFPDLVASVEPLLGLKASLSSHPAGVVIFDPADNIKNLCPEMWIPARDGKAGRFVMQYNLAAVDLLMLLKQDTLGLRTLDTIDECVALVEARHGVKLDPDSWVPDHEEHDGEVYAMLGRGETHGVFQMEGGTNHRGIQEIKPVGFEDIVTCTSLYRAGPMIAGAPARFLANKKDKQVRVADPKLFSHLERSWGEMIYQEQMFSILNEVAGLSWARVDDIKTATSKKDQKKMAECKADAIKGFKKNGIDADTAEKIWKMIASQSAYLFNRSHAVAYSMLSYQTARLKYLYPLEFYAAILRTVLPKNKEDKAKRERYMDQAIKEGFVIQPPDINLSDGHFMPHGDKKLLFGLTDIKGVGPAALTKIMAYKEESKNKKMPFTSLDQVASMLGTRDRSKGVYAYLADCGGLRSLGVKANDTRQQELLGFQFADNMVEYRKEFGEKIKKPAGNNSKCLVYGEIVRVEKRTTRDKRHFYVWTLRWSPAEEFTINVWEDADDLFKLQRGSIVRVRGNFQTKYRNISVSDISQVKVLKAVKAEPVKAEPVKTKEPVKGKKGKKK